MAGINKCILIGNVGRIESKQTTTGKTVVNLSIATSYKTKSQGGEPVEVTEWHNCVLFEKIAEVAAQYVTKGMKLYVEGALKTEKWQNEAGENRYATKIVVRDMQMLSSKPDGAPSNAAHDQRPPMAPPGEVPPNPNNSWIDDEIPF